MKEPPTLDVALLKYFRGVFDADALEKLGVTSGPAFWAFEARSVASKEATEAVVLEADHASSEDY